MSEPAPTGLFRQPIAGWVIVSMPVLAILLAIFLVIQNFSVTSVVKPLEDGRTYVVFDQYGWPFPVWSRAAIGFPKERTDLCEFSIWNALVDFGVAVTFFVGVPWIWYRAVVRPSAARGSRRFQFGLSTLLVLSVVAGGLLGLNLQEYPYHVESTGRIAMRHRYAPQWPLGHERTDYLVMSEVDIGDDLWAFFKHEKAKDWLERRPELPWNVSICLGILFLAGVATEARVRHKTPGGDASGR